MHPDGEGTDYGCARELQGCPQNRRGSVPGCALDGRSTVERITLHILNRKSAHRVHREYVDAETG